MKVEIGFLDKYIKKEIDSRDLVHNGLPILDVISSTCNRKVKISVNK